MSVTETGGAAGDIVVSKIIVGVVVIIAWSVAFIMVEALRFVNGRAL